MYQASGLLPCIYGTTFEGKSKLFATGFFVGKAPLPITIDQSEIVDFRWFSPRVALDVSDRGLIALSRCRSL